MILRTNDQKKENGSDLWQCAFVSKTGLYYSGMDVRELGGVAAKNTLMWLILLDKNCTQQDRILGEPRGIWELLLFLATTPGKTNWAVVEQH